MASVLPVEPEKKLQVLKCHLMLFFFPHFIRYEPRNTDLDEDKRTMRVERVNSDLLKKLKELDTDVNFSVGM